ncbi:MAG: Lrp/AsnC family transcriptional regulator [Bradymonadales bacterium]|jgi:Lrp/AsnC family leucine-responsive transcriptional regulator
MDSVDKKILTELQKDGRISNVELAKVCNLAPSSMLSRVRRIEEKGIIKSYRAILSPKAIGLSIQALVLINLDQHQTDSLEIFEAKVKEIPEVMVGYHVTGRFDYVLHIVLRDIDHLAELVKETLTKIPGMANEETLLIFSSVKEDHGYSLDLV